MLGCLVVFLQGGGEKSNNNPSSNNYKLFELLEAMVCSLEKTISLFDLEKTISQKTTSLFKLKRSE